MVAIDKKYLDGNLTDGQGEVWFRPTDGGEWQKMSRFKAQKLDGAILSRHVGTDITISKNEPHTIECTLQATPEMIRVFKRMAYEGELHNLVMMFRNWHAYNMGSRPRMVVAKDVYKHLEHMSHFVSNCNLRRYLKRHGVKHIRVLVIKK